MRSNTCPIVLAVAILSACASDQQQQTRAALYEGLVEFRSEIASDRRLDPIRNKVSLIDSRGATLSMLFLTTVPTDEERRALEEWQGMSRYWQLQINWQLQRTAAWRIPIMESARAASLTLLAGLYGAHMTYGEYNQRRLELTNRTARTLQAREQELSSQQEQSADQQSVSASASLSSFQGYLLQQRLINQQMLPVPAPFSCTRLGTPTNCF